MRRLPIKMQLIATFAIVAIIFSTILGFAVYQFNDASAKYESIITHTYSQIMTIRDGHISFTKAILGIRGFLLYPDNQTYEKEYRDNLVKTKDFAETFAKNATNPDTKDASAKLISLITEYQTVREKVVAAKKANSP